MLSLFRTNQAYAGLLLFVYAFLLWLPMLFLSLPVTAPVPGDGALGRLSVQWATAYPHLGVLLSVFCVGLQGMQMNALAVRHDLSRTVSQFPGLLVVLLGGMVVSFHDFNAFQPANVFFLFGLLSLSRTYRYAEPSVAFFNAGAWWAIASLFRPEFLLFFPVFLIAQSIFRRLALRATLQLLTGGGLVFFFLFVVSYLTGQAAAVFSAQFMALGTSQWLTVGTVDLIGLALLGLVLLLTLTSYGTLSRLLNIEGSKNTSFLAWVLLWSLPVLLLSGTTSVHHAQLAIVPLGALFGLWLVTLPPARAAALHLILFVAALLPLLLRLAGYLY